MSSTLTQSGLNTQAKDAKVDRKALRRPDQFLAAISSGFGELSKHRKGMLFIVIGAALIGVAVAAWSGRQSGVNAAAHAAFFDAQKTMDLELKKVALELAPPATAVKPSKPAKAPKAAEAETPGVESVLYARFDVEQKLPETVKKLKTVIDQFGGSTAAFEARLLLGDLYFDHGQAEKSAPWYSQAVDAAPGAFHRGLALYALGYAQENEAKPAEAIRNYEKALNTGTLDLKGDLLLATARSYVALNDQAKARSTYDQILSQMPDTEYAKTARVLKNELR